MIGMDRGASDDGADRRPPRDGGRTPLFSSGPDAHVDRDGGVRQRKTTVAHALVARLGWVLAEGDEFHPSVNVEKMRAGHPLDDDDRWPWLRAIAAWIG